MKKGNLELKMYSLVLYQLSGRQIGIQSGHANDEYGVKFNYSDDYKDWAKNYKTVIVLTPGGGSQLLDATLDLKYNKVKYVEFKEPDLYNQVTAVSFLVDERVFNRAKYPDFNPDSLDYDVEEEYEKWEKLVGGEKNIWLREWLHKFRLA